MIVKGSYNRGFQYEVILFSRRPHRWNLYGLMESALFGGRSQSEQVRKALHQTYSTLPDQRQNGLVTLPIEETTFPGAFKVMTHEKIEIFLKENYHLICVVQDSGQTEFSLDHFTQLEEMTQRIIKAVLPRFPGFSWISHFDPEVDVLAKHLYFFQMPKKRAHL